MQNEHLPLESMFSWKLIENDRRPTALLTLWVVQTNWTVAVELESFVTGFRQGLARWSYGQCRPTNQKPTSDESILQRSDRGTNSRKITRNRPRWLGLFMSFSFPFLFSLLNKNKQLFIITTTEQNKSLFFIKQSQQTSLFLFQKINKENIFKDWIVIYVKTFDFVNKWFINSLIKNSKQKFLDNKFDQNQTSIKIMQKRILANLSTQMTDLEIRTDIFNQRS